MKLSFPVIFRVNESQTTNELFKTVSYLGFYNVIDRDSVINRFHDELWYICSWSNLNADYGPEHEIDCLFVENIPIRQWLCSQRNDT